MQKNHAKRTVLALFLLFVVRFSVKEAILVEVFPFCQ